MPQTYLLNYENKKFTESENNFLNSDLSGIWIRKPANENRGIGIDIITNVRKFKA